MARVVALVPDLLFGSKVHAALVAGGHEVRTVSTAADARAAARDADVLVVDLASDLADGAGLVARMTGQHELAKTRTLGFYSHVDVAMRERAQAAGFDLVVPRSRMNREGAQLVARLAAGSSGPEAKYRPSRDANQGPPPR